MMRWQDYLFLILCGAAYLAYRRAAGRRARARRRRSTKSRLTRREQAAWRKLQAKGFSLEEIHPSVPVSISAGGKQTNFNWTGGFTVSKGGKTYLVRTVRGEASPTSPELRRDLLLDLLLFQPHGLYLYNGEKELLQDLDISLDSGPRAGGREKILVQAALILLIAAGLTFLSRLLFQGGH